MHEVDIAEGDAQLTESDVLLACLRLLGWQVELETDGDVVVGVARYRTATGEAVRVGACAKTLAAVNWQLFEGVTRWLGAGSWPPHV